MVRCRRVLLFIALTSTALPALAGEDPAPRRVRVTLLSYNLHQGADAPAITIGRFIQKVSADLVSLQEVPDQAFGDMLARTAGYTHKTQLHLGKMFLSKLALEDETVLPLVSNRSLIRATIRLDGIPVSLYGVHISWDVEGNQQARQIVESILAQDPNPRKILIGDFNDEHFSTQNMTLETLLEDAWSDLGVRPGARTSWPATGWAGSEGHQLIDLLLYDPASGILPVAGEIFNLAPVLSDHRPVSFTLELTDPPSVAPPRVVGADALFDEATIEVRFDREVDAAAAADRSHYAVFGLDGGAGPQVDEVNVDRSRRTVRLRTGPHQSGAAYDVELGGIPARGGTKGADPARWRYSFLPNLLRNPGAEEDMEGWEVTGSMAAYAELRQVRPHRGARFFGGGAADARSAAAQVVSLEADAAAIDAGRATLVAGAYLSTGYLTFPGGESRPEPYDDAEVRFEVLDAEGNVLIEASSGKYDTLHWHLYREDVPLPPRSRVLRVTLAAWRKLLLGGPQIDAAIDDVFAAVRVDPAPHGRKSGNLLVNPGAESGATAPWEDPGGFGVLANYSALSGSQAVAASGDWLFVLRSARNPVRAVQTFALPPHGPFDYLRWGGWLRTWASRIGVTLRVEILGEGDRLMAASSIGPKREAEWTRREALIPLPAESMRARFVLEWQGADIGAFADGLFAQVTGGGDGQGWFGRGDVERDGRLSITDAILILRRLFGGLGEPLCADAADVDDDGQLDLTDAVRLLEFLFRGGQPPPPPGVDAPGPDPTADEIGC